MTAFYSVYVSLCAEKKKSLSAVAEAIGLSRTAPNGWKKGKQPSDVTLQKLAQYFGVDVSVFTGETEKPHTEDGAGQSKNDENIKEIVDFLEHADLSDEALDEIKKYIEFTIFKNK